MADSIQDQIEKQISSQSRGKLFFPSQFDRFGSDEAVRQSLVRLQKKGLLVRLAHGIYLYPKKDKVVGTVLPSTDELAEAIARRDKARIVPTGSLALNKLGLSTQVPMKSVYLTDGAARSITIGKRVLKFKRTVPKNLAVKGKISSLVIQALREIGETNLTPPQIITIMKHLKQESPQLIRHDAALAPAWIKKIMLEVL
jgi:hypothetical protein